jgi:hypothetical protein
VAACEKVAVERDLPHVSAGQSLAMEIGTSSTARYAALVECCLYSEVAVLLKESFCIQRISKVPGHSARLPQSGFIATLRLRVSRNEEKIRNAGVYS